LRTPFEIAERLKIERGAALPSMIPHGEALEVMLAGSGERLRIPRTMLGDIIEARMSELFEMARDALLNAGIIDRLPGGVILSGGGALLPGGIELAQSIFQTPVRLGYPIGIHGWSEEVDTPQFATGVGLCRYVLKARRAAGSRTEVPIPASSGGRRIWGALSPQVAAAPAPAPPKSRPAVSPLPASPLAPPTASVQNGTQSELSPVSEVSATVERAPIPPAAAAPSPVIRAPSPQEPAPQDETPFDKMSDSRFLRRDELLARPEEPESFWRKWINKFRHFIGFEEEE
jgi:cell division ATPase FtsA